MKLKKILTITIIFILLITGCKTQSTDQDVIDTELPTTNITGNVAFSDMFTNRDLDASFIQNDATYIQLNDDSATSSSDAVSIEDRIITIIDEGTYVISGNLNNGRIVINAQDSDKVHLVLNNVTISSDDFAPIYIINADKVFITLYEGTNNFLINNGEFISIDNNKVDGVIFSKQDLTFNGTGTLNIVSLTGNGIVGKDDIVFTGGVYNIESAAHGIDANNSVRVTSTTINIIAGKDGIHSENDTNVNLGYIYIADGQFDISAEGDGVSTSSFIQIESGAFNILTGGGSINAAQKTSGSWGQFQKDPRKDQNSDSNTNVTNDDESTSIKGIKANGNILIINGSFTIDSADDSVHSNSSILINDGTFDIASGDDGFHADDTITITNGNINISKSYEGIEALHIVINGGNINIKASDDGLNAAGGTDESGFNGQRGNDRFAGGASSSSTGSITITNGDIYINAAGDGIDANGTLAISGGKIIVSGPTVGDTSVLDFDVSGTITGGTFIGTGSLQMAQTFTSSTQGVLAINAGSQPANTIISISDSNGKTILTYEADQNFALVIISDPLIKKGDTYTITVGSSTGSITAS